jgi:hypothetical protein
MKNISTLLIASAGEAAVAVTGAVEMPTPQDVQSVGQLIIQAIIALITVWKLVKKPKNNNDKI